MNKNVQLQSYLLFKLWHPIIFISVKNYGIVNWLETHFEANGGS
ncbi:hypothetical protein C427_3775 [Paraglaciecola psychrophila 170]|uniref:Uncharacterized protein n=1 Tax=Paraglaciecola psychrophila 170 TaxID=1129794 RepID=M4RT99_9ALTE|nr:hypothetical protein C427_3775 [Paraglaciecola psychrophila 170]